jgi:hypothetical protein
VDKKVIHKLSTGLSTYLSTFSLYKTVAIMGSYRVIHKFFKISLIGIFLILDNISRSLWITQKLAQKMRVIRAFV